MTEQYAYTSPRPVAEKLTYLSGIVWVLSCLALIAGQITLKQWVPFVVVGMIIFYISTSRSGYERNHKKHNKILREIDWEESSYTPIPYDETKENRDIHSNDYRFFFYPIVELSNDTGHTIFVTKHMFQDIPVCRVNDSPVDFATDSVAVWKVEDIATEVESRMKD